MGGKLDSFGMVHTASETESMIVAYWAEESWLVFQTLSEPVEDAEWMFGWYPDGDGYRICEYEIEDGQSYAEASAFLDRSDAASGCKGFAWDSIRMPFAARGDHEPLDSLLPTFLYEWSSTTDPSGPTSFINWTGYGTYDEGTTMVLGTMSPMVEPSERFIKIQVESDALGRWHVCLLTAAPDLETATAATPTTLSVPGACNVEALGGTGGWKLLDPI